jgi:hypothetical protein
MDVMINFMFLERFDIGILLTTYHREHRHRTSFLLAGWLAPWVPAVFSSRPPTRTTTTTIEKQIKTIKNAPVVATIEKHNNKKQHV